MERSRPTRGLWRKWYGSLHTAQEHWSSGSEALIWNAWSWMKSRNSWKVISQARCIPPIHALGDASLTVTRSAFRTSHHISYPPSITVDPRVVYHTLVPHPAFSPPPDVQAAGPHEEQSPNEEAYRQLLVQGALAVLLPTEDLGNACVRTLVADVIGEMILGNGIGGKACEGWVIWDGITKLVASVHARVERGAPDEDVAMDPRSRLEKFGLLPDTNGSRREEVRKSRWTAVSDAVWRILQYGYVVFLAMRFTILVAVAASSRPRRPLTSSAHGRDEGARTVAALRSSRPLVRFRIFSLISVLLDLSRRSPWLVGWLCLGQHYLVRRPLRLGADGGLVDRYVAPDFLLCCGCAISATSLATARGHLQTASPCLA